MTTFLRIKTVGTGTPADPIRVPLPTYRMLADMGILGWIVEVRDEDVPPGFPPSTVINVPGIGNVNVVTGLSPAQLATFQSQLDARYPQRDKASALTVS